MQFILALRQPLFDGMTMISIERNCFLNCDVFAMTHSPEVSAKLDLYTLFVDVNSARRLKIISFLMDVRRLWFMFGYVYRCNKV